MEMAGRDRISPMRKSAYIATTISANLGLITGGLLGYLYATSDALRGDPNDGMANLGLVLLAVIIIEVTAVVGGFLATYAGLRLTGYERALRTSLILLGLYLLGLIISMFVPPFLVLMLGLPLLARYLAEKITSKPPLDSPKSGSYV